jgi:hypothetical protein
MGRSVFGFRKHSGIAILEGRTMSKEEFFSWKAQVKGKTLDDFMKDDYHEIVAITLMLEGIGLSLRGIATANKELSLSQLGYTLERLMEKLNSKLQVVRLIYHKVDQDKNHL